ncbi:MULTISPECIES: efflux RND transporter periplasmic adaptor subunit [unclassified Thalassospira]|jgi:multidrug efflux system membrane fusion protein|uniref:efflux RND transporter periplasmic adaptor subunit n=1 Tax=Thalassospira TaxID=168934 RepID=UPI000C6C0467|nr:MULTISPECIES: efflux RND transporter periplasmic adaptor subunit [unclassified Thalassospira]MAL38487.1 efflux transporter periplasmic adaptor subunit [Thalassospira sp.]MBO6770158.1 efflux RND transporter periplasmic adaptor subunit [Thalassospira sp.]URK16927.1 efflux RND transporter periplasmic adaptor subunit [Thalassospira sp. GO-4]
MQSRSKRKILLPVAALALIAAAGGYGLHISGSSADEVAVQTAPMATPVTVSNVKSSSVRLWNNFSGRLSAVEEVQLRPQVSGAIVEIRFEDGQLVQKGDVLAVIDPRSYQAAVNEARAELAAAEQNLSLAAKEKARAEKLVSNGTVSKRVYDERLNAHRVAQSQVTRAKANLELAEIELDHAFVKAPISGRVSRVELTVGNQVNAGPNAPVLTTIVSTGKIYADFDLDEQTFFASIGDNGKIDEAAHNIPVNMTLSNGRQVSGYVHSFDNRIDARTGTIRTRALFDNLDGNLLPGTFAALQVGTLAKQDVITVSPEAISTDQDRKFVYVVEPDNTVAYRQVTLGAEINGMRIVTSGLNEGDLVIVNGIMKVRPGMPVAPEILQAAAS